LPGVGKEKLLRLGEVPRLLPLGPSGKRIHVSAVYRWAQRGIKGVTLQTARIGGTTYTSIEALQRFADQLSRPGPPSSAVTPSSALYRQRQINQAAKRVDALLNDPPKRQ